MLSTVARLRILYSDLLQPLRKQGDLPLVFLLSGSFEEADTFGKISQTVCVYF